ncbi:SDR family oxidoreductase [Parvularcula sp. LCG005]|uniref:SDR family oxidoreductase n=1 Tax=Parvularcula sp. LCG005 TaxID=3078805 RepID=UPI002941E17B|nr:SDR family oxidoreductase [Parvularcula sp. LCG005]WOI53412.1 SDR family oxidoreductase [Parvularcula sp. LCG005]
MPRLLAIGFGYVATALHQRLMRDQWHVTATSRTHHPDADGISYVQWASPDPLPTHLFADIDAVVVSVSPGAEGCPAARAMPDISLGDVPVLYLSSTGVYGDFDGDWVDETSPCEPGTQRGYHRLDAEEQWQAFCTDHGGRLHICRLAGIYGPGRSAIDRLLSGDATPRIIKPGQVFNRIHVDDIANGLAALIRTPEAPTVINFADDEPAPPQDVIAWASTLLHRPLTPEVPFEDAELSAMARSFYQDNKRLKNDRLKTVAGPLLYPTYREGLAAVLRQRIESGAS